MEFSAGPCPVLVRATPVGWRRAGSGWKCSLSGDIHSHNSICIEEIDSQACKIHSLQSGCIYYTALVQLCVPRCHRRHNQCCPQRVTPTPTPHQTLDFGYGHTWTQPVRRQFMLSSSSQELLQCLQFSTEALPWLWQSLCPRPGRIPCPAPLPQNTLCLAPPRAQTGGGWGWSWPPGCPEFPRTAQRVPGLVHLLREPSPLQLTPPKEPPQNWAREQRFFLLVTCMLHTSHISPPFPHRCLIFYSPIYPHLDKKRWWGVYFHLAQVFQMLWPTGRGHWDSELRIAAETVQLKERSSKRLRKKIWE